jgi:hypothetical protein
MSPQWSLVMMLFAISPFAVFASPANADRYPRGTGYAVGCSIFATNHCVRAATRQTSRGTQYRTRGGNWVWCGNDCGETIRRDVIDFWDEQQKSAK